ncbi:hypothetical protein [Glutamicibacter sp. NPDC087344]|uniref:hypothetical protein n=1 Tax=Glutamicibacter sp. NPDC087344 TaxID=3363994 RepID=UPI003830A680
MITLPILNTRFPAANPLYDLRGYLRPGIVGLGGSTGCWAQVTENLIIVSLRVNPSGTQIIDGNILYGLPEDLWPSVNTPDTAQQQLFLMADGRVWLRSSADWKLQDRTEVNAIFIAPRRA